MVDCSSESVKHVWSVVFDFLKDSYIYYRSKVYAHLLFLKQYDLVTKAMTKRLKMTLYFVRSYIIFDLDLFLRGDMQ